MSWKSVKNLLILVLIAVNAFLAIFVYKYYKDTLFTDDETARGVSSILEKSGIIVSEELISVKNDTADTLFSEYDREEYVCLAAAMLFGREADSIYLLPDGVLAETEDGRKLSLGYDMSIDYACDGASEALALADKGGDAKAVCELIESKFALEKGTVKEEDCLFSGEYTFVKVTQREEGIPLFGMECTFGVKGEEIVYANGKHFFSVPLSSESTPLLDRANVLLSERDSGVSGEIEEIELCYTLYEDGEVMMYVPSYRLCYSDSGERVINAISKKIY